MPVSSFSPASRHRDGFDPGHEVSPCREVYQSFACLQHGERILRMSFLLGPRGSSPSDRLRLMLLDPRPYPLSLGIFCSPACAGALALTLADLRLRGIGPLRGRNSGRPGSLSARRAAVLAARVARGETPFAARDAGAAKSSGSRRAEKRVESRDRTREARARAGSRCPGAGRPRTGPNEFYRADVRRTDNSAAIPGARDLPNRRMSATAPTITAAERAMRSVSDSPPNARPSATATIGLTNA